MAITALLAMVRKDLLLFFSDRRAVIVAFAVPIFIGSFVVNCASTPSTAISATRPFSRPVNRIAAIFDVVMGATSAAKPLTSNLSTRTPA